MNDSILGILLVFTCVIADVSSAIYQNADIGSRKERISFIVIIVSCCAFLLTLIAVFVRLKL
jgi:hypothetical protein